jgi:hypothetical protein
MLAELQRVDGHLYGHHATRTDAVRREQLHRRNPETGLHHAAEPGNHHVALRRRAAKYPDGLQRQRRCVKTLPCRRHSHIRVRVRGSVLAIDSVMTCSTGSVVTL